MAQGGSSLNRLCVLNKHRVEIETLLHDEGLSSARHRNSGGTRKCERLAGLFVISCKLPGKRSIWLMREGVLGRPRHVLFMIGVIILGLLSEMKNMFC
jgi:hypothetical protein